MVHYISPYIATQREYDSIGSFFESLSIEEQTRVLEGWSGELVSYDIKEANFNFRFLFRTSFDEFGWSYDDILDCIIEHTKGLYSCHTMYYDQEAVYFITEWTK